MTPTRVLPLEGGCNFRDCGGYATCDGARVRWGRLYRSGLLHGLAHDSLATLGALGLRSVIDLRRNDERALHPNPAFPSHVRRYEWDTGVESSPLGEYAFTGTDAANRARETMLRMYARMPYRLQARFAGVFEALAQAGEGATIVHCTAGKDRTGVAVALVLAVLDVPRADIMADYALTNAAVDLRAQLEQRRSNAAGLASSADRMRQLPADALDAVLTAHPDYLAASLDAIAERHGSVHAYVREELGVSAGTLSQLRNSLLE